MFSKILVTVVALLSVANAGVPRERSYCHQSHTTTTSAVPGVSAVSKSLSTSRHTTTTAYVPGVSPVSKSLSTNRDTSTTAAVPGGTNVGKGLNTSLYTGSKTWTHPVPPQTPNQHGEFTGWNTFEANGVNLGGWFEIETSNNPEIFTKYASNATDEWTFCQALGSKCGPIMDNRYATYYTTSDIDKLAAVGVNFLRIPMTYAAWVKIPESELHTGTQTTWLQAVTSYAINKYGMRVAIGLHSLPGGVNYLDIGEASGHHDWFYNATNLAYSYKAIESILTFIKDSGNPWAFSVSAINEASDNIAGFATPAGVTANGTDYIVNYINGVVKRAGAVDKRISVVLQDCFLGEEHWAPYFANTTNLVIDTHIYYFAASGIYSEWVNTAICGQASVAGGDGKFPVFVGEWSLQVLYNNTYDARESIFNTQRYAWSKFVSGGSFWSAKFNGSSAVDGEGTQRDYWNYQGLIEAGVIKSANASVDYCSSSGY